ncbi:hypothetical protein K8R43_01370 [archaeon]|nr:hypothetical protein [archaeon]
MVKINFKPNTDEIVVASLLSSISAVLQIVHVGIPTPIGMWIDLVAVPWLIAYFLKGFKTALFTAILSAVVIAVVAPTAFIGSLMKFAASLPMFLVPALVLLFYKKDLKDFRFASLLLVPSLLVRIVVALALNVYVAFPMWTGMSFSAAAPILLVKVGEFFGLLGLSSLAASFYGLSSWDAVLILLAILTFLNIIQGIAEYFIAWKLSFNSQLSKIKW